MFNKIFIICPTYAEDSVWGPLDQFEGNLITVILKVDENVLKRIWNEAREQKLDNPQYHTLIYFDDCGGQEGFRKVNDSGVINQLTTKGNHSNISTVYTVQRMVFCSPTMRVNAECFLTFYMQDENEKKRLYQEFGIGTYKNFCSMLEQSTAEPYHTFMVNRYSAGRCKYYHNFKLITNPANVEKNNKK